MISYNIWFLDRICTHLIVYEGDSVAKMYVTNWSDYEAMMQEKFRKDLTPAQGQISDVETVITYGRVIDSPIFISEKRYLPARVITVELNNNRKEIPKCTN